MRTSGQFAAAWGSSPVSSETEDKFEDGAEALAEDEICQHKGHEETHRLNKGEPVASGLDRNSRPESSKSAVCPPFAATACKNRYNGTKTNFVAIL
jgi:hypothetical protein